MNLRQKAIDALRGEWEITNIQLLYLNFIFPISRSPQHSFTFDFFYGNESLHEKICNSIDFDKGYVPLSKVQELINNKDQSKWTSLEDCKPWTDLEINDVEFIDSRLDYFTKQVFGNDNDFQGTWYLDDIKTPRTGKLKYKLSSTMFNGTEVDLFVIFVTPAGYQDPLNDIDKLGCCMKTMLDKLLSLNLKDPIVCGVLIQGDKCRAFKMGIETIAIYAMIETSVFLLPTDQQDETAISMTFQSLLQIKNLLKITKSSQEEFTRMSSTCCQLVKV